MSSEVNVEPPEDLTGISVKEPKEQAAGTPAVISSLKHVFGEAGVFRGSKGMAKLNQKDGFDCPSCAWPDPDDHRAATEFCENGAKALASETTTARIGPEFFQQYSIAEISQKSDYWMEQQGRITEPFVRREGATHYEPISWDDAFSILSTELKALEDPNDGIFYTSGRTVNESAFLYQLFVRMFGTNNLPDCSNMCHESSGAALGASIGIGKGTVTLKDIETAETVIVVGQNPGTNHPRMLSALQQTARNGGEIIAINPMKEAGLVGFAHPQEIKGMMGLATPLSTDFLPVKVNGDQALFQGLGKAVLALESASPGTVIDAKFVENETVGFDEYRSIIESADWSEIEERSGIPQADIERVAARLVRGEKKLITCWAMGLTQHRNAVATIRDVVNLHLMLGAIGRPSAGLCPVRGHSNVQGDRTMGIFEKMPAWFHDAIDREFAFTSPREEGYDTIAAIQAMHASKGKVFFALGGNFLQATPDTRYVAEALENCRVTAHVSTKLNRSHVVTGEIGLILPCLGRSELDINYKGTVQFSTVENSMGIVHMSRGNLKPISDKILSEAQIVARLAETTLGTDTTVDFIDLTRDYDRIRDCIARTLPGFEDFNRKVRQPGGFYLPNGARDGQFATESGKAEFQGNTMTSADVKDGEFLLMTIRSHDQFNTTVYGLHDRYRGISNERRLVFLNPKDMEEMGVKSLEPVDLINETGGRLREAHGFLAIPYEIPRHSVAGYFPELNSLVPVELAAEISNTPCSKSVPVKITKSSRPSS